MNKRTSYIPSEFQTREAEDKKYIEGYFIVFNERTELWPNFYEEIAPEAVKDLSNVRALYNHNHDLVLGTTLSRSLALRKDDHGVYGTIEVNEKDSDAMNAYERIKRGDVRGCSFGFFINSEDYSNDGEKKIARVKDIDLFEVSPCVFPAYPQTEINARLKDFETHEERERKARQSTLIQRKRGISYGTQTSHQSE